MRDKEEIKAILQNLKLPMDTYIKYKRETLIPALLTSDDEKTLEIKKILNIFESVMREIRNNEDLNKEQELDEDSED